MRFTLWPSIDLRLFDGDAGAAPADAGTTGEGSGSDLSKVVYGKEPDGSAAASTTDSAAAGAEDTLEARQARFDELINSDEYKDIYTKRTQDMINRRFAKAKAAEAENAKLRGITDLLNQRYGITDDADFSKLSKAVENDDEMWSRAADEAGMSTQQYRELMRYKMMAERAQAIEQEQVRREQSRERAEAWFNEARTLREKFPEFDLQKELADPNFVAAINAPGMSLELAYKAKYFDRYMSGTAQAASQATEKRVVDNIRAKGARPAENGTSQSAAATIKSDPSKLSLADFDEIARRVARGEKIVF
jgi:hypothetical protein